MFLFFPLLVLKGIDCTTQNLDGFRLLKGRLVSLFSLVGFKGHRLHHSIHRWLPFAERKTCFSFFPLSVLKGMISLLDICSHFLKGK